ncbi:hypothetical protein K438DRAFT_880795 [Mycena galopus ATCC 62051]|nr:hypothetical protein K438DRAFT_880795 [Mycena galopus ATCC 62051]
MGARSVPPEAEFVRTVSPASDAGFFVFPDLYVRTEGSYRLKLCLFEVVGNNVRHCKCIYSTPFYVSTAKKFPGVEDKCLLLLRPPATPFSRYSVLPPNLTHPPLHRILPLTCSLADQGTKIRIRKDIRMCKTTCAGGQAASPSQMGGAEGESF